MSIFTAIHVVISMAGIVPGLVVMWGMLGRKRLDRWTAFFLITTAATSVTGFFFPFHGLTPAIVVGIISVVLLAVAILARYARHLAGAWRWIYVVSASVALYFNVFVLVVQLFRNVPALNALAPTQSEPPFAITQLIVLIAFVVLAAAASIRFQVEPKNAAFFTATAGRLSWVGGLFATLLVFQLGTAQDANTGQRLTPAEIEALASIGAGAGTSGVNGIQTRILKGDPNKPGLYTIQLTVPANTKIEAHTHPDDRAATVISGTWYIGYNSRFDEKKLKALAPGSFYTEPPGVAHFARTGNRSVVIQITGYGPTGTKYTEGQ
jgi:quercetin dioxygenase-like cupin family protein